MPLSPAPLLPGSSPLHTPGRRPPNRKALRIGAIAAVPTLVVALLIGQLVLPQLLFLAPSLQAQAGGGDTGAGAGGFQGFVFNWTARDAKAETGGYTNAASLQNLQFEAKTFHMNAVIIPVVADMPERSNSAITWHSGESGNQDTLPEGDYIQAINDARKAGLTPILELEVKQQDPASLGDETPALVGSTWAGKHYHTGIGLGDIGELERGFINNYVEFAVHYAQLSAKYKLPYFIFGDQLTSASYDTDKTTKAADPDGIDVPAGEGACSGRRDCEWRHVVYAIKHATYTTLQTSNQDHTAKTGGSYTGKLIYASDWNSASEGGATTPEFEGISWWDAVDYIGVNANFQLTASQADPAVNVLQQAWQGQGAGLAVANNNIYARIEKVSDTYKRSVIFTSAGYLSVAGANSAADLTASTPDQDEQLNDMQALLLTFKGTSWWMGTFWNGDMPISPREAQPNWSVSAAWAGNTLKSSKKAGQWLASYYQPAKLP